MKRKLLLLLCALLATVGTWAGILDGWTKMETTVVANPQNYYFIILHTDNTLMLGSDGTYVRYLDANEPSQNLNKVWTIESSTSEGHTDAYVFRSLGNVDNVASSENDGTHGPYNLVINSYHENSVANAAYKLTASGNNWNIENPLYKKDDNSYFWGAWDNATYVNNERVAGNAGANGNEKGSYNIYYMDRVTFNKKYQFLGGTDMNHMLVNRGFEYGNHTGWNIDNEEGATITIKGDATGLFISEPQSGSKYCYMNGNNSWGALYQTVNNLPDGTYSSSIYLCNDINFLFNNTSAESWKDKTPSGRWSKITITNQNVEGGSTQLRIRGWGDNRFADEASLTFIPSAVGDIATAYTAETATEVYKWYSITIPSEGSRYWIKTSNAATLRYTTSASTLQTAGTENVCSADAVTQTSFAPGSTVYIATTASTILSIEDPYVALNTAIETAEGYTLGFDAGEYAPYTNVDALTRLATAKSIYDAKTATYAEVVAAKEALTGATWTDNDVEKDAVYNGNMAVADGTNPKGWARQNDGWGKQVDSSGEKDHDFSKTTNNTAWYYNNNNSSYYGGVGHYTMPLKGSTTYLLRVKYCSQGTNGGGLVTSLRATVKKGETTVLNAHELGGNSTRTFEERSVTFTTTDAGNYVLELTNTGNFFFTDVSILKAATAADYTALNSAIAAHTPGFDEGEYAPYTNVDAMVALAAAKAIDQEAANLKSDVQDATDALTGATWTANTELMDALYDGGFLNTSVGDVHEGVTGWTTMGTSSGDDSVFRQVVSAEKFDSDRGLYIWPNTFKYGETDGYTMPLKANSYYRFTISYGGWNRGTNSPTVSILNTSGEGLTATQPGNAAQYASGVRTYETVFRTGAAGNYVLSFISAENTNTVIGDIHLTYLGDASANMAVNATAQWGTFCAPFAVTIPDGVTAYTCASATDGKLNLVPVATTIPANTPVILNAESGLASTTFYGKKVDNATDDLIADGLLVGNVSTSTKDVPSDGSAYLLQLHDNKVGFYKANGTGYLIGNNRCYLLGEGLSYAREAFFFEDDATAISALEAAKAEDGALKDGKYMENNRIFIVKNGVKYGANGQKLN